MNPQGAFKPYLYYSALVHAGLIIAMAFVVQHAGNLKQEVYRIDFIGPTGGIMNREVEAASGGKQAPTPAETPPQPLQQKDSFRRKHSGPLPKPSILKRMKTVVENEPVEEKQEAAPPAARAGSASGEGSGVGIEADMPNFPYPWYITSVRSELWQKWSQRMPGSAGEAMIQFSILKNGSVVDLRVESSSGDAGFDFTALSAVQDAAGSFPPLPRGFSEPFLKVHVKFQAQ